MNDIDKRLEDGYSRAMGSVSYDNGVYIGAYVIHLRKQLQAEREEKERLELALQFYADGLNFSYDEISMPEVLADGGRIAKSALGGDRN